MPRGDSTGRNGNGPMTGRAMGYCAGYDVPGYVNGEGFGFGQRRLYGRPRGLGFGLGYGRGLRSVRYANVAPIYDRYDEDLELEDLKAHAANLERELKAVHKRLDTLGTDKTKEGDKA
ncbi:DUF5320 domain-containing protein [Pleomorphochaeta sp. DL1XJH-081]|uniref:DUF5320 domain-containing protein n=1 Tax=Pleomorphochaeta sp. DL1XJH-081 TaxID=3409690 RepID=UPI003BB698B3